MQFSFAQEKTITGVVSGANEPLPGANVVIKGSNKGVSTGFDGSYSIKAKEGDVLVFSFLGMTESSKTVGVSNVINAILQDNSKVLGEVVVQGYGKTTTKAKSTGATQTIGAANIENRPNVNVLQTLQGQVAGANIASFSGQPGSNKIDVIIRGVGSLSASADPLYVIDGIPLTQSFFRNLNANDIESVSVLKDASATAIYGNRGANGVIIINTKKGTYKKSFQANYSSSFGTSTIRDQKYNLPTAIEHLKMQQSFNAAGVGTGGLGVTGSYLFGGVTADPANLDAYAVNTDWKKVFFQTGKTTSHDLNFTTGGENSNNYSSLGYFEQDGIAKTTKFKRFTVRNNFNGKSSNEKFSYGLNFSATYSRRNQFEQETRDNISNNVLQNPLNGYLLSSKFLSPSLYTSGSQLLADFGNPSGPLTPYMLMDLLNGNNAPSFFDETKMIISGTAAYKITNDLTFSTTAGTDYAHDKRNFAIGPEAYLSVVRASGAGQPFHGLEQIRNTQEFTFDIVNKLTYKKVFAEKHTIEASLFQEYMKAHRRESFYQQIGLNPLTWEPGAGTGYIAYNPATMPTSYAPAIGASKVNAGLLAYFGSLDYDYEGKYGLTATARRDGSYRFVDKYKWGTFWSAGARWNISKENFLKDSSVITDLKLRGSYGITGNQNVLARGIDANAATIFIGSQIVRDLNSTLIGYENQSSFGVSSYANKDLHWEETSQWNIGLDFGIKNRLTGSVDVYNKKTTELYVPTGISAANGIVTLSTNNGALQNRGIEASLKYDILKQTDLRLSIFANGAYNESNFLDLGVLDPDGDGKYSPTTGIMYELNRPINQYHLIRYVGVDPADGNLLYEDINGNLTQNPTAADRRTTNKNSLPKYQGGFGLNADYKGFFADLNFVYAFGAYKFDIDYAGFMDPTFIEDQPVSKDLLNAWTPTNTNTDVPALTATNDIYTASDRFLRDASYVRLRSLSFGYDVPAKFLEKTFVSNVKFRLQGENLLTFTKWKGFDPESLVNSQTGYYPTPKIITFGVDVKF